MDPVWTVPTALLETWWLSQALIPSCTPQQDAGREQWHKYPRQDNPKSSGADPYRRKLGIEARQTHATHQHQRV